MITKDEALVEDNFHTNSKRPDGTCYNWRRNGQTKVWKTKPSTFRIPVKYGLYNYGYITPSNAHEFHLPTDACK